jgi:imidazolonepropionase-like amidohydrolase
MRTAQLIFIQLLIAVTIAFSSNGFAAEEKLPPQTLFTHVNIFNGTDDKLYENHSVPIEGNVIKSISEGSIDANANAIVLDGGGRTLMPGLIESHVHMNLQHMVGGYDTIEQRDWQEIGAMGAATARGLLMDGWTTVRDPGGTLPGLKRAVDKGLTIGPRMYLAGAVLSQTAGHGDWRLAGQRTLESRDTHKAGALGIVSIADGFDANLSAARQNLANGAVLNKFMFSGGVFSSKDPLHVSQYTDDEVKAILKASEDWGTYATAHTFLAEHAQRGIRMGMKELMHVPFMDEATAKMFVENGVYLNVTLGSSSPENLDVVFGPEESVNKTKARAVVDAMANLTRILKEMPELLELTTFGADVVTVSPPEARRQRDYEMSFWAVNFGTFATLRSMTSVGGKLATLTGKLNPYPDGPLGVIEEGAYADLLLVDGNPLKDITLLGANSDQFTAPNREPGEIPGMVLIMKDGKIYKNTL